MPAPNAKRVKGPVTQDPVSAEKVLRSTMITLLDKYSTESNCTLLKTSEDTQVGYGLPKLDVKSLMMM